MASALDTIAHVILPNVMKLKGAATLVQAATGFGLSQILGLAAQRSITDMRRAIEEHVARLPISDSDDFASWLLTDFQLDGATVMIAPARGFYATPGLGADQVRIAYVLKEADLRASVEILRSALETYAHRRGAGHARPTVPDGPDLFLPQGS